MQEDKFRILCCSNFREEIDLVIEKHNFKNIEVFNYAPVCGSSKRKNYSRKVREVMTSGVDLCIIGCLNKKYDQGKDNIEEQMQKTSFTCFDYVIQPEISYHFMRQGHYVMTPGWLNNWEFYVKKYWKFDQKQAKLFFRESANSLLLFDTTNKPKTKQQLSAMSSFLNLPHKSIPVGINHLANYIEIEHEKWKNKQNTNHTEKLILDYHKEKSNFMFIFQVTKDIAQLTSHDEIVKRFMDLFNVLFSPKYIKFNEFKSVTDNTYASDEVYKIHEKNDGFSIKIEGTDKVLGELKIESIKFPKNLKKYLNLSLYIVNIIGLALNNSILFKTLENNIAELEKANNIVKEANEAKNQLFSIIAHDLRTPFNVIAGYIDLMNTEFESLEKEQVKQIVEEIDNSSKNFLDFLNNLLDWARTQLDQIAYNPKYIELCKILDDEIKVSTKIAQRKEIDLIVNNCEKSKCFADPDLIKVVFRNILSNAMKFSKKQSEIHISCEENGQFTTLTIKDFGIGMTKEQQSNLFKQIFTTEGTGNEKGTGLGLITSYKLIEKNNGKLEVNSTLGNGTSFKIKIPKTPK